MQSKRIKKTTVKPTTEALRIIKEIGGRENLHKMSADYFRTHRSAVQNKLLFEYWSFLVKVRAGFECEFTGATKHLNSHHILGRKGRLLYELDNGVCITITLHLYYAHSTDKLRQLEFDKNIKRLRGRDVFDRLRIYADQNRANTVKQFIYFQQEHERMR